MLKSLKRLFRGTAATLALLLFLVTATQAYAQNELVGEETTYKVESSVMSSTDSQVTFVPVIPWIGMTLGQLLGWIGGTATTIATITVVGMEVAKVIDFASELARSNKPDKPRYFKVRLLPGTDKGLYIGEPLTDEQAHSYVMASIKNDVWTPNEVDAKSLAMRAGQGRFQGSEIHWQSGFNDTRYYHHYHGGDNYSTYRTGHIFYGTNSRLGANKRN